MKDLSVFLPSYNRPFLLSKTIDSFLKLNLKNSQIVVIDHGTDKEEIKNDKVYNLKFIKNKYKDVDRVILYFAGKKISWEDQFKIYLNYSEKYQYFSIISDDDFFLSNKIIAKKINKLNENKNLSFVVSSAYMFELSEKKYWKRSFVGPSGKYTGKEFIEKFINEESLQHNTVTGIFRINYMKKTECFKILEKIRDNELQAGYGLDTRLYFRNALLGDVLIMGNFKSRAIRFHDDGMTYNQPIESSYCYYWNIIDNINYLENNGMILNNRNKYIEMWINNLLSAHIINYFFSKKEKNYKYILALLDKKYLYYIENEISKNNIQKSKKIRKYILMNKILSFLPRKFIASRETHIIPNNLFELILNLHPFYFLRSFFVKNKKIIFISKIKNILKNYFKILSK